jgi:hypothetical protein
MLESEPRGGFWNKKPDALVKMQNLNHCGLVWIPQAAMLPKKI